MSMQRNFFAMFANSILTALIGLAIVPLYLKYLGIEAYGLVGFFATLQTVLQFLDMGLAPTINREVARHSAAGNLKGAGKLLHTLAVVYWSMALAIFLFIVAIAPLIAGYWLQPKNISPQTVRHAVMLMGLVVACRWPIGLYQGALMGAQHMTVSSAISLTMYILSSCGAVAMLAFVSPTIEVFFMWQAGSGLVYVASMRFGAWRVIGRSVGIRFDVDELMRIWRFSAGVSGVVVSAIILTQLDKMLLSRVLALADFGRYMLAGVVAGGLYMIITPTFNVIYPRLSALVVAEDTAQLLTLYRSGTRLLLAVLFPIAATAAVYSEQILALWTRNPAIATSSAPIVSLFLIGTALNGAMHFPYALQLAFGKTRLPITINMILITVMIPTTLLLALRFGAIGGAGAWAVLNCVYLFVGTWLTHRSLLKGMGLRWLLADVGIPLGISLVVILSFGNMVRIAVLSNYTKLFLGSLFASLAFILIVLVSSGLRVAVKDNVVRAVRHIKFS